MINKYKNMSKIEKTGFISQAPVMNCCKNNAPK